MPESVKVALYIAAVCSVICTVGCCLFFTAAKRNDAEWDKVDNEYASKQAH